MADPEPFLIGTYTGIQKGWLRRKELDTISSDAWEQPDGTPVAMERGRSPIVSVFRVVVSEEDKP